MKRNLFSKIVAGIGALAMVATMLPAMSLSAEAATTVEMTKPTNAKVYVHVDDAAKLANPDMQLDEAPDGDTAGTYKLTKGSKYVLVPDEYYEYSATAPRISYKNGTSIAAMNPLQNPNFPSSYIFTVPSDVEDVDLTGGLTLANYFPLNAQPAKDAEVIIRVHVDQGIEAYDRTYNPNSTGRRLTEGSVMEYKITRKAIYTDPTDPTTFQGAVFYVNNYPVIPMNDAITNPTSIEDPANTTWFFEQAATGDKGHAAAADELGFTAYGSPIVITAAARNGAFDIATDHQDMTKPNADVSRAVSYKTDELFGLVATPPATEFKTYQGDMVRYTGTGETGIGPGKLDTTAYISLYELNGDDVIVANTTNLYGWETLAIKNQKVDGGASNTALDRKAELPDEITKSVEFVINAEDIYRLYALGYATDDDKEMNGRAEHTNRRSGYRNNNFKYVDIYLGHTPLKDVGIKWENGAALTNDKSIANTYNYSYVFRDKDGKRFDSEELLVGTYDNSWSSDPGEYPEDGYKGLNTDATEEEYKTGYAEGKTETFKLMIDPLWTKADNFDPERDVYAWAYDNDRSRRYAVRNLIKYDKETDTYTFTVGHEGPYRIVAENIVRTKTGKVRAIPQSDALFGNHGEDLSWVNLFYNYDIFEGNEGIGAGGCNVRNPRFQWFTKAHEEDEIYFDLMSFAMPGAVATSVDWNGHEFPVGEHKFKLRFSDTFITDEYYGPHGKFDDEPTNDRYALGSDGIVTVTVDGTKSTLTPDDNGLYTIKVEADKTYDLRVEGTAGVEGVVPAYQVHAPNVAAYDIEPNWPVQREANNEFISSVPQGEKYRFKLNLAEGTQKGPDFKVMNVAWQNDANNDNANSFVPTELKEGSDGYYEFVVNNDCQIIVYGLTGSGFLDTSNLSGESQLAIDWLLDNGMTEGDGEGHFMPNANTRRGDFVLMLYRYYGEPDASGNGNFSDVASDAYYAKAVAWGTGKGIINGYPDGTFRPMNVISRAEVANILSKLCGLGSVGTNPFTDVTAGDWFYTPVMRCYAAGIVNGTSATTFTPNAGIIREHYALMLYRSRAALPAK